MRFNSKAVVFSIILHLGVLLFFIISFEYNSLMPVVANSNEDQHVITATVADLPKPQAIVTPPPVAKAEPEPPKPQPKPEPQIAKAEPKPLPPVPQAIALKPHPKKMVPVIKPFQASQLLDDLQAEVHKQKKTRDKALAKHMEKQLKLEAAKSLERELAATEAEMQAGAKVQGEVDKYKALILQAISQRWIVPGGVDKKLTTELLIRLAPGGSVLSVEVTRSSGVPALDRSARDAVYKASPLPVPEDPDAFDRFRQFALKVRPESVIMS